MSAICIATDLKGYAIFSGTGVKGKGVAGYANLLKNILTLHYPIETYFNPPTFLMKKPYPVPATSQNIYCVNINNNRFFTFLNEISKLNWKQ